MCRQALEAILKPSPGQPPESMNRIASSIPGRMRVRLDSSTQLRLLEQALRAQPHIRQTSLNPRACSLLVEYDANACPRTAMEACVLEFIAPQAEAPTPGLAVVSSTRAAPRRHWRFVANRYAKAGAVAAMSVSLAALAWRNKRLHTQAGIAALLFTALHMYIHKRNLTR